MHSTASDPFQFVPSSLPLRWQSGFRRFSRVMYVPIDRSMGPSGYLLALFHPTRCETTAAAHAERPG